MEEELVQYQADNSDNLIWSKVALREVIDRLRAERELAEAPPEFKRRISLVITNIEQGLLWITPTQNHEFPV